MIEDDDGGTNLTRQFIFDLFRFKEVTCSMKVT
jgi:hypothetical protein